MNIQERIAEATKKALEKKGVSTTQVPEIKVMDGQYVTAKAKSGK